MPDGMRERATRPPIAPMQFAPHEPFGDDPATFITLAWNELFDPTTPDSFRPRLHSTHSLVAELGTLAELAETDKRWSRHIGLVKGELQSAIQLEGCWLKHSPWSMRVLQSIADSKDPNQIQDLAALFGSPPNPFDALLHRLRDETKALPKNKERTLAVLRLLGTHAIRNELVPSDVALDVPDTPGRAEPVIERLRDLMTTPTRPFKCIVHLSGDPHHIHSQFGDNAFRKAKLNDFPLDELGKSFKSSISVCSAFRYETMARSHLAAAATAVRACRRIIDTFNFHQNRASIQLDANMLVVDGDHTVVVNRHTESSLGTKPSRAAPRLTRDVLARVQFDELDMGLENALEQHSLALASGEPKASLVGFWTAFECLVGSDGREAGSKRVVEWIAPIVALRRVEKVTRYLAVCCHEYYKVASRHPSKALKRSSSYYVSPRDLFDAITGSDGNSMLDQLLADIDHPLLRFRLDRTWRDFHDAKSLKKSLVRSRQNVAWQLERIYRARNLTVHKGIAPPFVSELVDSAQHYFTRSVSRVLNDLRDRRSWTVATALELHRQRFLFVVDRFANDPSAVSARLLFPGDDEFDDYWPWRKSAQA